MTKEKFEKIIEKLNEIKPYHMSWCCGDEFGGYGREYEIEEAEGAVTPLICDREVFGFSYDGTVYYRTDNLNAQRIAKLFASNRYLNLQKM